MDWTSLLYGPVYSVLGVDATLTLNDTAATEISLTAIDKTAGVEVGSVDVQTIVPAAIVRASELASISLATLEDGTLLMNGRTWTIKSHMPKPSPGGEDDGEIYLILYEGA